MKMNRRAVLVGSTAFALTSVVPPSLLAADRTKLRFSFTSSETDIRARAMQRFGEGIKSDFDFQPYYNATLFKQGTEVVAMQRGNLEMSMLAPHDIAKQVPEWSIITAAYVFRNPDHALRVFASDVGKELYAMVEERLGIKVLAPVYYGTRQVALRTKQKINTPADMNGIKLRMPGGEVWQMLGKALGANPTPMAFTEVYTGLQTGAIDGQDNPLPTDRDMKFDEVSSQIVLTGHWVAITFLSIAKKVWDSSTAAQQNMLQTEADKAIAWSTDQHLAEESELVDYFKKKGLDVYTPDVDQFRAYAQKMYLGSELSKTWIPGMLERINKL